MTCDPHDTRCHRCHRPTAAADGMCSELCRHAPTGWERARVLTARVRQACLRWTFGHPHPTGPTGPSALMWLLHPADIGPDWQARAILADWLTLHGIATTPDALEIRRHPSGVWLHAGPHTTPLILTPPGMAAAYPYATIHDRDLAAAADPRKVHRA